MENFTQGLLASNSANLGILVRYTTKDMTGIKEEVQQQTRRAGIEDFSVLPILLVKKETQTNGRVIFILCNSLLVELCTNAQCRSQKATSAYNHEGLEYLH